MLIAPASHPLAAARPSTRECAVRLGMPQLTLGGLSETWLLKELGAIHWQLIAEAAGLEQPAFRDTDGADVYPAFCGTSIAGARLNAAQEHDLLVIASDLARVSATQCASRHHLMCRGQPIGEVSLSSVFVKRGVTRNNQGLVRVASPMLDLPIRRDFVPITALASSIRSGRWQSHFGFSPRTAEELGQMTFQPCPAQDFNGAGLLYFPSFSAFVDRAEWAMFGQLDLTTKARDVVYHGNIDPGETVVVSLLGLRRDPRATTHWCQLTSPAGRRLADVFTSKTHAGRHVSMSHPPSCQTMILDRPLDPSHED